MNEGVKILLERMKTNPEEFVDKDKWASLLNNYKDFLDEEDRKAIADKINNLMQQKFTEAVMKELLDPEEDNSLGKPWYTQQGNITLSAGQTQGASLSSGAGTGYPWNNGAVTGTINAGTTTLSASQTYGQAKLTLTTEPLTVKKPVVKKHTTLFGKLFNYS
jgi:hypothetical protein